MNLPLPHYKQLEYTPQSFDSEHFNNYALMQGEVKYIYYPDDEQNISGQIEYVVDVKTRKSMTTQAVTSQYRCLFWNMFGGADNVRYTLRPAGNQNIQNGQPYLAEGSLVLVMCVNAQTSNALIVGGFNNNNTSPDDPNRDAGHFYNFTFNGATIHVNKDGELSMGAVGATDAYGKPLDSVDANNKGPTVTFAKDGSVLVTDNSGDSITIDSTKHQINIATKDANTSTSNNWAVTANGNVDLNATGTTKLGPNANSPMVKGDELTSALSELIQILISGPVGVLGGAPVALSPALLAALQQWQIQYASVATPILSSNNYTR